MINASAMGVRSIEVTRQSYQLSPSILFRRDALTGSHVSRKMDGPTGAETEKRHSYGAILKSSALIGATSVLNVAFAIARNKAMAVLLEPSGFGLIGLYASIAELAQNIFGLGVNSSAVREVAAAVASGETERIAKTVIVLRRLSLALGIFGAAVLAACSSQIAQITFGNSQHTVGVAMLSLAVLFRLVSASQNALLQGMRRIRDMATQAIIGNLFGTLISIAAVFVMRDRGIVPALVAAS